MSAMLSSGTKPPGWVLSKCMGQPAIAALS
ncbi:hypothetical protein APX70_200140 [Pseudomonas syringae pv. maculicola]|uniref:Uncharacterized protein n=1 Tax=Pseudomonas syringae pv. maculicola TaxID=59511 RepID=A0A3M2VKV9_PSEYM|nr:hypothetical protein APX70_200140 [Pseudomonas syringae pv. maculicola]